MASLKFVVAGSVSALIAVPEVGGDLAFDVQLTSAAGLAGDLKALLFDISNEALLAGLTAAGSSVPVSHGISKP